MILSREYKMVIEKLELNLGLFQQTYSAKHSFSRQIFLEKVSSEAL
jgi:hypothetical protein